MVGSAGRIVLALSLMAPALPLVACGGATAEISTEAVELPPADPRAVREFVRGNQLMARGGRGNRRRARDHFERALEIDRYLWEAHYNLGVLDREDGQMRSAIRRFEAARQIQPGAAEPLLALAEAQYAMGRREDAAELLKAFVRDDPDSVPVRVALATILRELDDQDEALEHSREALIRDPQNVQALAEIGRIYRAREQFDVAELVFRKALALSDDESAPENATIHNDLGLVALARGDTQVAFSEFARAIEIQPSFTPARMNQGSVLLNAGDFAAAAAEYEAVLRVDDEHLDARVALGICLRGQGDFNRARREYEAVLDESPNHAGALFNLAVLRAEFLDQRPQSRELFERFLDVAPRTARDQREMAERYLQEIPAERPRGRRRGG